ncbi:MAG TPA: hypothetical protein VHD90_00005, partial [Phototrophicaceae bacterium]|nr:hypothetical protein [Phototrophicaceae bacterium]
MAENQGLQSVRVEVALDLVDLATDGRWFGTSDDILPTTIDFLVGELNSSSSPEVATHLAKLDLQTVITLLQSDRLKPLSVHLLARESLNRVFYPRTRDNLGNADYEFAQFGVTPILSYRDVAGRLSTRRFYIPDKMLGTVVKPTRQRQLLTVIVDTDRFWTIPTNMFSFFFDLPDSRDELRALLAKS